MPPDKRPQIPLQAGEQYRFHFNMNQCIGCKCCEVACHEQNNNPATVKWRKVGELEGGEFPNTVRLHVSMACNHCLKPSCLEGCPVDAYYRDATTGAVRMRDEACIGCGYCTWNCPYEAPQFNAERNMVTKCDLCHNRLTEGLEPACVAACPSGALELETVNIKDWESNLSSANAPGVPDASITVSTTRFTNPKNEQVVLKQSNDYRLAPEKPHYSLNGMTVLTQLSVGGFLSLFFTELIVYFTGVSPVLEKFLKIGPIAMLGMALLALVTSVFHLGRPLFAFRALKMWKRSWLSREVLFFSLFALLAGIYSTLCWKAAFVPSELMFSLGGLVALTGISGIYSSAKIYMVPARPSWNTIRTPLAFFSTALFLGPLSILFLFTLQTNHFPRAHLLENGAGLVFQTLIVMTVIAAFFQLAAILVKFFHILNQDSPELRATAKLLSRRFRLLFLSRLTLLLFAMVSIPLALLGFILSDSKNSGLPFGLAILLGLSLIGELIGRHLFYVTVVPQKRPEGYFQ
jgi:formate dehydrogenase iron-sulfur subunit